MGGPDGRPGAGWTWRASGSGSWAPNRRVLREGGRLIHDSRSWVCARVRLRGGGAAGGRGFGHKGGDRRKIDTAILRPAHLAGAEAPASINSWYGYIAKWRNTIYSGSCDRGEHFFRRAPAPQSLPLRSVYRALYVFDGVLDGVRLAMEHDKVRDLQARLVVIDSARRSLELTVPAHAEDMRVPMLLEFKQDRSGGQEGAQGQRCVALPAACASVKRLRFWPSHRPSWAPRSRLRRPQRHRDLGFRGTRAEAPRRA